MRDHFAEEFQDDEYLDEVDDLEDELDGYAEGYNNGDSDEEDPDKELKELKDASDEEAEEVEEESESDYDEEESPQRLVNPSTLNAKEIPINPNMTDFEYSRLVEEYATLLNERDLLPLNETELTDVIDIAINDIRLSRERVPFKIIREYGGKEISIPLENLNLPTRLAF